MKLIKLALISFIVFFLIITGFSLFIPSNIRISKAIDINATKEMVVKEISTVSSWKKWYPGADSADFIIINNEIKGIATASKQKLLLSSISDSSIQASISGSRSGNGITGWNFYDATAPGVVTVQWYMDFHLRWYPWEKFSGLMFETRYGPTMENGLNSLKKLLENNTSGK